MKIIIRLLVLPLLFSCSFVVAQVKTNFNNETIINEQGRFGKPYKVQVDFEIPAKNIDSLVQVEKQEMASSNHEKKPFRLAVPVKVDIDIAKLNSMELLQRFSVWQVYY